MSIFDRELKNINNNVKRLLTVNKFISIKGIVNAISEVTTTSIDSANNTSEIAAKISDVSEECTCIILSEMEECLNSSNSLVNVVLKLTV